MPLLALTLSPWINRKLKSFVFSDTCTGSGNEFQCWDGTCVARAKLCDRNYDCPSYDDELNCEAFDLTNACTSNTDFACFDNTDCIVYTKLCDGVNDCADGSDENGCNPPGKNNSGNVDFGI